MCTTCSKCDTSYAANRTACPNCEHPNPHPLTPRRAMNYTNIEKVVALLVRDANGEHDDRIMITLSAECDQAIVRATERQRDEGTGTFLTLAELAEALRLFAAKA